MNGGVALFIVIMTAITTAGWVVNSWIKTKRGAAPDWEGIAPDSLASSRQIELLSTENSGLKGQVGRLEERIAVLERIATDPAERTAREIDGLR